ncbi:Conserved hypothetical protein, putative nitroreductase [Herminiimonas arsenicoxydans]|uniref:Nitroreductase domain-containing protein n=1 Tax=Herminiimonas arsenicoxydans TaxID=204773 RepID=A4G7J6_HERAR|nr:Conserved hypothetical protein, putative nitroreductase [Herminiimonas arsenicoxydans]
MSNQLPITAVNTMTLTTPLMSIGSEAGDLAVPLLQVLLKRKSIRNFSDRHLSLETLSHLLWSACGINRPEEALRTNPSARNWQEIDVYVAMEQGLYLFDPHTFTMHLLQERDMRAETGIQDFVPHAPVNLIYVADLAKMEEGSRDEQEFLAALDTGFISQNVYLFCAAAGLATVVRGLIDRPVLTKAMNLRPEQRIIVAQSVGYAAD